MASINWSIFAATTQTSHAGSSVNCNEKDLFTLCNFQISAEFFISIKNNTVSHEFNTIRLLFQNIALIKFDIATKSKTQLFATSLFSSINKADVKTIDTYTALNIIGIDMNHDNEYDFDLSLFKQNQVKLKRLEWMEMLIEYGLKFGLNINDMVVDETYNSVYIVQQWIETKSIVKKVQYI